MRKLLFLSLLLFGVSAVALANYSWIAPSDSIPKVQRDGTKGSQKTNMHLVVAVHTDLEPDSVQLEAKGPGINGVYVRTKKADAYTTFNVSGLKADSKYTVRARYIWVDDTCADSTCVINGDWSDWKTQYTEIDYPKTPVLEDKLDNCPSFVGMFWSFKELGVNPDYLQIKKTFNGGKDWYDASQQLSGNETSFYDLGPNRGVTTGYKVLAFNSIGDVRESNVVTEEIKTYQRPSAPLNLRVSEGSMDDTSFRITWDNPEEDTKCGSDVRQVYYVEVNRNNTMFIMNGYTYPYANYYDIWGLNPGEEFEIAVWAMSDQDIPGEKAFLKGKTFGPASSPTNFTASPETDALGNGIIQLAWENSTDDADYLIVEVSTDGDNYEELTTLWSTKHSLKHINISEGVSYTYRIKAGNYKYGESEWVYTDGFVNYDYSAAPNTPYGLNAKWNDDGNVWLTWIDDSNKEEGYYVERSDAEDGTFEVIASLERNTTSYTDELSDDETGYFYRVRAFNSLGESEASNVAGVTRDAGDADTDPAPIGILAYPNPTVDFLNISVPLELKAETVNVKVYNQLQQLMVTKSFDANADIEVNVKNFTPGIYNIVVETGNFKETKKVIKN